LYCSLLILLLQQYVLIFLLELSPLVSLIRVPAAVWQARRRIIFSLFIAAFMHHAKRRALTLQFIAARHGLDSSRDVRNILPLASRKQALLGSLAWVAFPSPLATHILRDRPGLFAVLPEQLGGRPGFPLLGPPAPFLTHVL